MKNMKQKLNERLAELIEQHGYTQKELAQKAGVTEAAMSHYLKGDRVPRASVLMRLAETLGVTTDYLMGGDDENGLDDIQRAQRLIARNVYQMTKEQKMNIIKILMSDS